MSDLAIEVVGLSKSYRIGRPTAPRQGRDFLPGLVGRPFGYLASTLRSPDEAEIVWALKDVSCEVRHGEVIGIIGRNGAGKSTLLKILSRITEPTAGRATLHGRVSSLLEVGIGFHPELTGRENIYLNGAIMGMKKSEIARRFDEIVEFAGVRPFIDTPVKRFSSGMFVRLAFAVAAHLDPDILLVDEVLAVGDVEFQKKCLGAMSAAARSGRTVLFVSHNMSAVLELCSRSLWIDQGTVVQVGETRRVIQSYLQAGRVHDPTRLDGHPGRRAGSRPIMTAVRLLSAEGESGTFETGGRFRFEVECRVDRRTLPYLSLGFMIRDAMGGNVFGANMKQYDQLMPNEVEAQVICAEIERLPLSPGAYTLSLFLGNGATDLDVIDEAVHFDVMWDPRLGLAFPPAPSWGAVFTFVEWPAEQEPRRMVRAGGGVA
jgi:lipopolysaccharide transport system ATP-binding protein